MQPQTVTARRAATTLTGLAVACWAHQADSNEQDLGTTLAAAGAGADEHRECEPRAHVAALLKLPRVKAVSVAPGEPACRRSLNMTERRLQPAYAVPADSLALQTARPAVATGVRPPVTVIKAVHTQTVSATD